MKDYGGRSIKALMNGKQKIQLNYFTQTAWLEHFCNESARTKGTFLNQKLQTPSQKLNKIILDVNMTTIMMLFYTIFLYAIKHSIKKKNVQQALALDKHLSLEF